MSILSMLSIFLPASWRAQENNNEELLEQTENATQNTLWTILESIYDFLDISFVKGFLLISSLVLILSYVFVLVATNRHTRREKFGHWRNRAILGIIIVFYYFIAWLFSIFG